MQLDVRKSDQLAEKWGIITISFRITGTKLPRFNFSRKRDSKTLERVITIMTFFFVFWQNSRCTIVLITVPLKKKEREKGFLFEKKKNWVALKS
jgi:hypothetical protein